jgi:hypothetical protein
MLSCAKIVNISKINQGFTWKLKSSQNMPQVRRYLIMFYHYLKLNFLTVKNTIATEGERGYCAHRTKKKQEEPLQVLKYMKLAVGKPTQNEIKIVHTCNFTVRDTRIVSAKILYRCSGTASVFKTLGNCTAEQLCSACCITSQALNSTY